MEYKKTKDWVKSKLELDKTAVKDVDASVVPK